MLRGAKRETERELGISVAARKLLASGKDPRCYAAAQEFCPPEGCV